MQFFLSPDFNIKTLRKKPQTAHQKLRNKQLDIERHSLTDLSKILASYIPQSLFDKEYLETNTRRRVYSTENTFWGFFSQILKQGASTTSIVHDFRVRYFRQNKKRISASNAAFCQAKKRLSYAFMESIYNFVTQRNNVLHPSVNRRIVSADGTGLTASDTQINQTVWPQQKKQKEGCAFPQLRLCALFNLHSGVTLDYRLGNKNRMSLNCLENNEVLLKKAISLLATKDLFVITTKRN